MFFHLCRKISYSVMLILNKKLIKQPLLYNNLFIYKTFKYSTLCDIDRTLVSKYIQNLQKEYEQISNTDQSNSQNERRLRELIPFARFFEERNQLNEHLSSLNELLKENDEEMRKLAEEETVMYQNKILEVEKELLESLVPPESVDMCDSIVLEVNAGVGGQEAMLFARELFDMYWNFSEYKGWSCQLAEFDCIDIGGLRHASILITGHDAFKYFKYEAGVHRVQRIPATERAGRVHTSTVSVIALPQPRDIDVTIHDKDLKIETKRASGAGGQHVNTTDSAVRIVHLPTNISVECQVDRSQVKNREIAMQKLKAMLYEQQLNSQIAENEATRKSQVRSNYRNEKIRTYNFSQDRITDHRLHGSNFHNLKVFLVGGQSLETLINKLQSSVKNEKIMKILTSVE